jgi:branched-chain amino acid transport system permease protein
MSHFWALYQTNIEFALVGCVFALSIFVGLWSGVLSVAPVAFAAVSAFAIARISTDHPTWSLYVLLIIGMVIGAVFAFITSFVFLRLSSHYLALATIALVLISRVFALNLTTITGGMNGVGLMRLISFPQLVLILVLLGVVFHRLRKSRFGLTLDALREQPEVTASLGVDVLKIQRVAFVLAGSLGGLAGVMQAQLLQYLTPDSFYVDLAFVTLASAVLGGAYHWFGPIVGSLLYAALPELLRPYLGHSRHIANGVLLLIIMLYLQRGVIDPLRSRPFRSKKTESVGSSE